MIRVLLLFLSFVVFPQHIFAEVDRDKVIIVLDASGSMWGEIDQKPKINIAKNVVRDLVKDWDPSVDLGLTVYGHRRKSDCNDIEAIVPVAPVNQQTFEGVLNNLQPKGKTPLTSAVQKAASELKYTEQKATVILVSDGIETCDYDPCKVAEDLEKTGVDFTAHVIGFDIQEKEAERQLNCLAKNTGGMFMNASDAASLKGSLDAAVKEVAKTDTGVELFAVTEAGGEPLEKVYWEVFPVGSEKSIQWGKGNTPRYTLDPGRYLTKVKSQQGKARAEREFEVVADQLNREEVILPLEGIVKLVAVTEPGGKPLSDMYWQVMEELPADSIQKPKAVSYGKGATPEYQLLPGTYFATVRSTKGKASAEQKIEVVGGKQRTIEVQIAQEGIVKLLAVTEKGGKPLDEVYWEVETIVPADSMEKPKKVTFGKGSQPEYKLLPGKYMALVRSRKGLAKAKQEIEVVAGKRLNIEVNFPAEGDLELAAVAEAGGTPLPKVYWEVLTVVPADSIEKPERLTSGGGSTPRYRLLPGRYLVRATSGQQKVEKEVEVLAGKRVQEEVLMTQKEG